MSKPTELVHSLTDTDQEITEFLDELRQEVEGERFNKIRQLTGGLSKILSDDTARTLLRSLQARKRNARDDHPDWTTLIDSGVATQPKLDVHAGEGFEIVRIVQPVANAPDEIKIYRQFPTSYVTSILASSKRVERLFRLSHDKRLAPDQDFEKSIFAQVKAGEPSKIEGSTHGSALSLEEVMLERTDFLDLFTATNLLEGLQSLKPVLLNKPK